MKRMLAAICALVLFWSTLPASAQSPYWTSDMLPGEVCCEDRVSCEVLQMVMMGSFARFDQQDTLSQRVFSAMLPMLKALTQEDIDHFCAEFGVAPEVLRPLCYVALGNCLWASFSFPIPGEEEMDSAVKLVLRFFLDPQSEPNSRAKSTAIHMQMDEHDVETIAAAAGLPADFVRYLMESEDWRHP